MLENQWLFAFLPVRQMGFKFLIHADFDTQANRQDIVTSSPRNAGLADGVAKAFVKAVLQLCDHATLRFQWMRYLPQEDAYPWDDFWKTVIQKIKEQIMATPVLVPENTGPLRLIRDSRSLPGMPVYTDATGHPLFADIYPERYLSTQYSAPDLFRLGDFGLAVLAMDEIIARARSDLGLGSSRIRDYRDDDWQTRVAKVLRFPFQQGWHLRCEEVKALQLLPLRTGQWTATTLGPVYFDKLEGTDISIPLGLPFRVIDPASTANASRKHLFSAVGVQNILVSDVQAAVLHKCRNGSLTLPESIEYLRFLFLTQLPRTRENGLLPIFNHHGQLRSGSEALVYLPEDDDPYGAVQLFRPTEPGSAPGCGAPGFEASFLNDAYLKDPPTMSSPADGDVSWKEWLVISCNLYMSVSIYMTFTKRSLLGPVDILQDTDRTDS